MWPSLCPNCLGILWASWTYMSISFARLGKFSLIIFLNKFPMSCSSSSPSGIPLNWLSVHLKLAQMFLGLSSFIWILVSFCSRWTFISSFYSRLLIWMSASFTVGSLYIFLYFTSVVFTSLFCSHTQSFLWASWAPVFWTLYLRGWLSLCHLVLLVEF